MVQNTQNVQQSDNRFILKGLNCLKNMVLILVWYLDVLKILDRLSSIVLPIKNTTIQTPDEKSLYLNVRGFGIQTPQVCFSFWDLKPANIWVIHITPIYQSGKIFSI
jgi:hypothetical protein